MIFRPNDEIGDKVLFEIGINYFMNMIVALGFKKSLISYLKSPIYAIVNI